MNKRTKNSGIGILLALLLVPLEGFVVIAHRGASGYEPENTLRAFARAIDMKSTMIELDVHCCVSGELVVIHDETLERTTDGTGLVSNFTLAELKKLNAGNGERIPTLAEVFDLVDRRAVINIELKGLGTALPTVRLIREYVENKGWSYDDFLVSSFEQPELELFIKNLGQVRTGLLCEQLFLSWNDCEKLNVSVLGLPTWRVTQHVVNKAHERGLKLYVFTVDDKNTIERLKNMGVDGVFSNYTELFT